MVSIIEEKQIDGLQATSHEQTANLITWRECVVRMVELFAKEDGGAKKMRAWFAGTSRKSKTPLYEDYRLTREMAAGVVVSVAEQLAPEWDLKLIKPPAKKQPTKLNFRERRIRQIECFNKNCKALSSAGVRVLWYFDAQAKNDPAYPRQLTVKTTARSIAAHVDCALSTVEVGMADLREAGIIRPIQLSATKGKPSTWELYPRP